MKKYIMPLFWFVLLGLAIYYTYDILLTLNKTITSDAYVLITRGFLYVFVGGISVSALLYDFLYSDTVNSLNAYKRELEKDSINKTESSSKIKVLESKIEVLEKALDQALNK